MLQGRHTFLLCRRIPELHRPGIIGRRRDKLSVARQRNTRDRQCMCRPFQTHRPCRHIDAPNPIIVRHVEEMVVWCRGPCERPCPTHAHVDHREHQRPRVTFLYPYVVGVGTRDAIAVWGEHDTGDAFEVSSKGSCEVLARGDAPYGNRRIPGPADEFGGVCGKGEAFDGACVGPAATVVVIPFGHLGVGKGVPEEDAPRLAARGDPATVVGDGHGGHDTVVAGEWGACFAGLMGVPGADGAICGAADELGAIGMESDRVDRARVSGEDEWL